MWRTPAARARSSCASFSTSTTTGSPDGAARSARARSPDPSNVQWLSFQSTAPASEWRFSTPPPTVTAYVSSARRPGVVLRVCVIRERVPSTASTTRRVTVAMPDRRCRKLRATRSPESNVAARAPARASTAPAVTHAPSAHSASTRASGSSSAYTSATIGRPATTKRPSATNWAHAGRRAAAPSRPVVTSLAARSSSRARRTASRWGESANRQHPVDGAARPPGDGGGHGHLVLQVAQRVAQLLERDLLHEAALGRLGQPVELLVGVLAAQPVQHARLGGDHEAPGRRSSRPPGHLFGRHELGAAAAHVAVRLP